MAFLLCALAAVAAASSPNLRGVSDELREHYLANVDSEYFTCLDNTLTVAASALNDDFCDCPDASDEPGTSACEDGRFWCANKGHAPLTLYASRVNDGLCDCCDGSDEYASGASCVDDCWEQGAAARAEAKRQLEDYERGLSARAQYVADGAAQLDAKRARVAELEAQVAALQGEVDSLQASQDAAEADEKAEQERRVDAAVAEWREAHPGAEVPDDDERDLDDAELYGDDDAEYYEVFDEEDEEDLIPDMDDDSEDEAPPADAAPEPVDEGPSLEDVKKEARAFKAPAAEEARKATKKVKDDLGKVEKELAGVKATLDLDYGMDGEFVVLEGKCFSKKTPQYTYEVCPFGKAKQSGDGSADLGKFVKFNEDYSAMLFENGGGCWQGPRRSIKVQLECGAENELLDVDEPSRCVYTTTLRTPAACHAAQAEEIRKIAHDEL